MNKKLNHNADLKILLILSFILSGITPFCSSLTSSKLLLEICSGAGVKVIELTGAPIDKDDQSPSHKKQQSCYYCFATQMAELIPDNQSQTFKNISQLQNSVFNLKHPVTLALRQKEYRARAPPYKT